MSFFYLPFFFAHKFENSKMNTGELWFQITLETKKRKVKHKGGSKVSDLACWNVKSKVIENILTKISKTTWCKSMNTGNTLALNYIAT